MKKVGIVTILSNNYGNRLQNYALQTVLCNIGYCAETLQRGNKNNKVSRALKLFVKKIMKYDDYKIREFDKRISWSPFSLISENDKKSACKRYTAFAAGSDQIWNPYFATTDKDAFLTFADNNKRIAYAASFGINEIPRKLLPEYKAGIKAFSAISVREKQAVSLVEQFDGCKAHLVLDPTLLLTKEQWNKIEVCPDIQKPFAVKYFLGDEDENCDAVIQSLLPGIEIIDVKKFSANRRHRVGPAEFLGLISNSKLICTDSFHGSIFSVLFERPLVIFERSDAEENMSSRISSLCEILDIENRRYYSKSFDIKKALNTDYSSAKINIEKKKEESIRFLSKALENAGR
ncbi:MAG: polysaccharide pyruvyl transferase family protein [Clostridiales bacterium]|nr:polysaccharide pyruvyl transferase family protein [Clostridiales bacterium]